MSGIKNDILLISTYEAKSHKYWREFLEQNLRGYNFHPVILPPRFFSWRVHGNPIILNEYASHLLKDQYDLVIATSMCDMATIKGFYPNLARTPLLLYFHENQFAYPGAARVKSTQDAQIKSLNSAVVADKILFNSAYNMQTFFSEGKKLLKKMPDFNKIKIFDRIWDKCSVLPVPIIPVEMKKSSETKTPVFLWNHRWEYDKAPERFFQAFEILKKERLNFKLNVVGQQFRSQPDCFEKYRVSFQNEIINWGYVENIEKYHSILRDSDFVVSTSLHEFQGLAVLEAVSAGAVPIVPDRLAYKEIFSKNYKYQSFPDNPKTEANLLSEKIKNMIKDRPAIPDISGFYPSSLIGEYSSVLSALLQ